jgi:hypothetical protein
MNVILDAYARQWLKDSLALCSEKEQAVFMMMYSHQDRDLPIATVVDRLPTERLDWVMVQVKRTLDAQKKRAA